MMPQETQQAVDWALQQTDDDGNPITKDNHQALVDKVRQYFNDNAIEYSTFSYKDLEPFLS